MVKVHKHVAESVELLSRRDRFRKKNYQSFKQISLSVNMEHKNLVKLMISGIHSVNEKVLLLCILFLGKLLPLSYDIK